MLPTNNDSKYIKISASVINLYQSLPTLLCIHVFLKGNFFLFPKVAYNIFLYRFKSFELYFVKTYMSCLLEMQYENRTAFIQSFQIP